MDKTFVVVAHCGGEEHYLLWDAVMEFSSGWTTSPLVAGHFYMFEDAQKILDELKAHMQAVQNGGAFTKKFHQGLGVTLADISHRLEQRHMQVRVAELEMRPKLIATPNNYFHVTVDRDSDELTFL